MTTQSLSVNFTGAPVPTDSWNQIEVIGQTIFAIAAIWVVVIAVRLLRAQWGSGEGPAAEEAGITGLAIVFGATVAWIAGGLS